MSREQTRYFSILDGASVTDLVLADGGYNYYLYMRMGIAGSGIIMRENVAESEYRFHLFHNQGDTEALITTYFAGRAGYSYSRPNAFKNL